MKIGLKRRIALILVFCAAVTPFCGAIYAAAAPETEPPLATVSDALPETSAASVRVSPAVKAADIPSWTEESEESCSQDNFAALYVDGIRIGDCLLREGTAYVSAGLFCEALNLDAETAWDAETETLTVSCGDISLVFHPGDKYYKANDRYFYVSGDVFISDDALMLPIRNLAEAFSLVPEWDGETRSVCVNTKDIAFPEEKEYDETDLYWLSHIIYAESGNQPLDGMIGVGNVVLNRVQDPGCPDSIYGVIFDRRYGVQFSPTVTGTIYDEPNEMSVVAAKLCLDGCNVAGNSLYFLNPAIGVSSWFARTRTYVTTIGEHVFYA